MASIEFDNWKGQKYFYEVKNFFAMIAEQDCSAPSESMSFSNLVIKIQDNNKFQKVSFSHKQLLLQMLASCLNNTEE